MRAIGFWGSFLSASLFAGEPSFEGRWQGTLSGPSEVPVVMDLSQSSTYSLSGQAVPTNRMVAQVALDNKTRYGGALVAENFQYDVVVDIPADEGEVHHFIASKGAATLYVRYYLRDKEAETLLGEGLLNRIAPSAATIFAFSECGYVQEGDPGFTDIGSCTVGKYPDGTFVMAFGWMNFAQSLVGQIANNKLIGTGLMYTYHKRATKLSRPTWEGTLSEAGIAGRWNFSDAESSAEGSLKAR